jgi:hypothetical protein
VRDQDGLCAQARSACSPGQPGAAGSTKICCVAKDMRKHQCSVRSDQTADREQLIDMLARGPMAPASRPLVMAKGPRNSWLSISPSETGLLLVPGMAFTFGWMSVHSIPVWRCRINNAHLHRSPSVEMVDRQSAGSVDDVSDIGVEKVAEWRAFSPKRDCLQRGLVHRTE